MQAWRDILKDVVPLELRQPQQVPRMTRSSACLGGSAYCCATLSSVRSVAGESERRKPLPKSLRPDKPAYSFIKYVRECCRKVASRVSECLRSCSACVPHVCGMCMAWDRCDLE
eukprot:364973-Chlamydomonas_euryale.AAC.1